MFVGVVALCYQTLSFLTTDNAALVSRLSDNKSSSVCVLFTTNLGLIFKGVVSSRINWFAFSSRHALSPFPLFRTFMNGQLLKCFIFYLRALKARLVKIELGENVGWLIECQ